jgi:hypothetical protein
LAASFCFLRWRSAVVNDNEAPSLALSLAAAAATGVFMAPKNGRESADISESICCVVINSQYGDRPNFTFSS